MSAFSEGQLADTKRRLFPLALQIAGVGDIVIGLAVTVFGPALVGDPALDGIVLTMGAAIAVGGAGLIWWGRARLAAQRADERTPTVVGARR